jgi:hypothetical protein
VRDDEPREYDRTYLRPLPGPLRLRFGVTTDRGDVRRFLVQLEYWLSGEWQEVVRYDHDPAAPDEQAHDITEEGLHVDIYREGKKVRSERVSAPLPPDEGFDRAEEHLLERLEVTVRRFEEWHGIRSR